MRPTLRELYPVRPAAVFAGMAATAIWLAGFGSLAVSLREYAWWTLAAGGTAWLAALALSRHGNRGVAAGVAVALTIGWSGTALALAVTWVRTGSWPLW
jgi:hypothetical protein